MHDGERRAIKTRESESETDAKILLAYATKCGATREIAERIGDELREAGLEVDVAPVERVVDPSLYTAVVLGSAVYVCQWRKEAAAFLETHERELAERPVWLFSSGETGAGDASELMQGWRFPAALQPIADRIQPGDIAFCHGVLDAKKISLPEKLIVKGIKAPVGDYRV